MLPAPVTASSLTPAAWSSLATISSASTWTAAATPYHSHVIYSDDRGATWQLGGNVEAGTNECAVAQLYDGSLYINCRNHVGGTRRAVARSQDQGQTFAQFEWDETLIEPVCQASLESLPGGQLLFANPASTRRERMTVRLSSDGGRTWPTAQTLHPGPAAYSDLAALPNGELCCLYESGDESTLRNADPGSIQPCVADRRVRPLILFILRRRMKLSQISRKSRR